MERNGRLLQVQLLLIMLAVLAALASIFAAGAFASPGRSVAAQQALPVGKPGTGKAGTLSGAQKLAMEQGYLVPNQGAYERIKSAAAQKATGSASGTKAFSSKTSQSPELAAPQDFRSWQGPRDSRVGPSDSTGAIGTDRYIELINLKYAIYNRTDNTPISEGSLNRLVGEPTSSFVFDPQMIWDPGTNRFYYAMDDVRSSTDNRIAFGFSKTATPSSSADWCKYTVSFGSNFPDYPKLGDTKNLLLIGTNTFRLNGSFRGSDLVSVSKPPAGTGCPAQSSFTVGKKFGLRSKDGTQAITPVPANQTDTSGTGWVVAESTKVYGSSPIGDGPQQGKATPPSANYLSLYKATSTANGTLRLSSPRQLRVPSYSMPASAPQRGTSKRLDTLDARTTQAVSAIDPTRGSGRSTAIWTQHTVFGGPGAVVRWYEINPAGNSLIQKGTVTGPRNSYAFNAAISPDRKVEGATKRFGYSMALGFNTSSATRFPDIRTVSKIGNRSLSKQKLIKASSFSLNDFTCSPGNVCRWGDYSAATPDPAAPAPGVHGRVWFSDQWVHGPGRSTNSGWITWNWAITI